jgi:hypothetical protein
VPRTSRRPVQREWRGYDLPADASLPVNSLAFEPLSDDELAELDHFMLYEVDGDEGMTLDMLDGYLHAIAIGPITLTPRSGCPASGDRARA